MEDPQMTLSFPAAVFRGVDEPLQIEQVDLPDGPPPGEVLVELAASGLCFSDLHVLRGDWPAPTPLVLGHEGAGVVRAVGAGVRRLQEGDHVILCWTPSCGVCRFCASGRPSLCDEAKAKASRHVMPDGTTRLRQGDVPVHSYIALGTFGRFVMVQESAAIAIRRDVPLDLASLVGCAVTTGIGAVINTAKVEPGASVLVLGCGGVGLSVVQGAALARAATIVAVDLDPEKRQLATTLGATHALDGADANLPERLTDLSAGRGFDYAFEAIGAPTTTDVAIRSLGKGGTAVLVGQVPAGVTVPIDPLLISDQERVIRGSNYGSARPVIDFPRILDLYARGVINLDLMVTERIPLEEINSGFDAMRAHRGARTVVEFDHDLA
jgi:S-(hydroxymethyl)glutathione dehydrogenase/alcohol dehydrogenase